jgi:Zn-finger nucleic acid-binding protein
LAFSLFQKFFSITRTIFSHTRSEQFWKQNTIYQIIFKNQSQNYLKFTLMGFSLLFNEMLTLK